MEKTERGTENTQEGRHLIGRYRECGDRKYREEKRGDGEIRNREYRERAETENTERERRQRIQRERRRIMQSDGRQRIQIVETVNTEMCLYSLCWAGP